MDVDTAESESTFGAFGHSVLEHAEAEERDECPLLRHDHDHDATTTTPRPRRHDHDAATRTKARDRLQRAEKMAPTHPHPSAWTTTANEVAGPFAAMLDRARDAFSRS